MAADVLYGKSLERRRHHFLTPVKRLSGEGGIKRLDTTGGRTVAIRFNSFSWCCYRATPGRVKSFDASLAAQAFTGSKMVTPSLKALPIQN